MEQQKILAVDDSAAIRNMVTQALAPLGYDIVTADDGFTALQILQATSRQAPIILIISDVTMHTMNGIEFVQQVRQTRGYEQVPVLFLTTETSDELKQQARDLRAKGWINKPFDVEQLRSIVAHFAAT